MGQSCAKQHDDDQKPSHKTRKKATAGVDAAPINELAAPNTTMQLISQTVTLRTVDLAEHSLTVMVAQRLPVHPQQLFKAANTSTWMRAAVDELVLAIQQALCAEYGVDRIQDIPAGVLPKLSEEGETEQVLQFIVAQFIVARCPLDGQDDDGWTGLMCASYAGHVDIVNALILAGAAIDIEDEDGYTGLICASIYGHTEIINALIMAGAVLDIQDENDRTALMAASSKGHADIVNALILAGAALDIQDVNGWTALMNASMGGHTEIENALRAAGATQ